MLLSIITLSACIDTATIDASSDKPTYSGTIENYNNDTRFYVYIDPDTGVNYIVYTAPNKGGITPRYNLDGSLFVTEN